MTVYIKLYLVFFKCGLLAIGGGTAAIPLIEHEVINTFNLMTVHEFTEAYALGQTLPGPIATKLSALAGYKTAGPLGAFLAVLGLVTPSSIAIILLYKIYSVNSDLKWLKGMMKAVKPIVVVMILNLSISAFNNSYHQAISNIDKWVTCLLMCGAFICIVLLKSNPITVLISAMVFGALFF